MNESLIEFNNITKKFPRVIANNKVSFNINKSSVHALLGENGAGKSTLVKVLYGLLEPDEGHINFNNENLKINLVLTAHPTEVKRRTLIQKYTKVNDILERFNNLRIVMKKNIEVETSSLEQRLHEEITSIWKTDELKRSRPSPAEEAKWGLAVIEDSLWNAVPKICSRFDKSVYAYTGKHLPINFSPIVFGSWMGGDRDGNPNVTAKTTEEIILLARWEAANLYERELTKLIESLSMHECSKVLKSRTGNNSEPYRFFLRPIRNKMKSTQKEIELHLNEGKPLNKSLLVQSISEVIQPLIIDYDSLCAV